MNRRASSQVRDLKMEPPIGIEPMTYALRERLRLASRSWLRLESPTVRARMGRCVFGCVSSSGTRWGRVPDRGPAPASPSAVTPCPWPGEGHDRPHRVRGPRSTSPDPSTRWQGPTSRPNASACSSTAHARTATTARFTAVLKQEMPWSQFTRLINHLAVAEHGAAAAGARS